MTHPQKTKLFCAIAAALVIVPAACAQVPNANGPAGTNVHPNSIQPETTLSLSARGSVNRAPDLAYITAGVETEAKTAAEALSDNAARMNGVFSALEAAGIENIDIQTSNFNVSPNYDYGREGPPRLTGYRASNQVRAKVKDLDNLGETLDSLVSAGGNTLSGIQFGLEDDRDARNEARKLAMADAMARAELYASASGYNVSRIVSISEGSSGGFAPTPLMAVRSAAEFDSAPSPVSGGELEFSASINVVFELAKE